MRVYNRNSDHVDSVVAGYDSRPGPEDNIILDYQLSFRGIEYSSFGNRNMITYSKIFYSFEIA